MRAATARRLHAVQVRQREALAATAASSSSHHAKPMQQCTPLARGAMPVRQPRSAVAVAAEVLSVAQLAAGHAAHDKADDDGENDEERAMAAAWVQSQLHGDGSRCSPSPARVPLTSRAASPSRVALAKRAARRAASPVAAAAAAVAAAAAAVTVATPAPDEARRRALERIAKRRKKQQQDKQRDEDRRRGERDALARERKDKVGALHAWRCAPIWAVLSRSTHNHH